MSELFGKNLGRSSNHVTILIAGLCMSTLYEVEGKTAGRSLRREGEYCMGSECLCLVYGEKGTHNGHRQVGGMEGTEGGREAVTNMRKEKLWGGPAE